MSSRPSGRGIRTSKCPAFILLPGGTAPRLPVEVPKFYILDMFPYPSGAGLHVGHPEGYTATDILARYKRACGLHVLHPMGWDAFGLPAEQYAIKTGQHPRLTTEQNVATFKRQIKSLGFSYDWSREIDTTDPDYFRWTQWIFLKLYNSWFNPETNKAEPIETLKYPAAQGSESERRAYRDSKRLAYVSEVPVWWCEQLGTVLANEEVVNGKSEVGDFAVVRKPMRQWMLRITAYAERLLNDLDTIDWSQSLKEMQRNWLGRSEGAEVDFEIADKSSIPSAGAEGSTIRVFTTRPDTLFGATYMVLAPEHRLVNHITSPAQRAAVEAYQLEVSRKSDLERTELAKDKTGVFTGGYAINPVTGREIPIWIADYVLISYGTGAIMAVPGHDTRDFEFATKFSLPILQVVEPPSGTDWHGLRGGWDFGQFGKPGNLTQWFAHRPGQTDHHGLARSPKGSARKPSTINCVTGCSAASAIGVNLFRSSGRRDRKENCTMKPCRNRSCRLCRHCWMIINRPRMASHRWPAPRSG